MACMICGHRRAILIDTVKEEVKICDACGYGRPSIREPMQYDEAYESKYLAYPEDEINKIRLNFVAAVGSLLDFGCGSGSFVRAARAAGFDAYGYDVNDFTSDLRPPDGFKPEIITAWDSFEHLTDEQQKEFFELAKSAKCVYVSIPDFESASWNVDLDTWRHYRPAEHLHYYTAAALARRFKLEGFTAYKLDHGEDAVRKAPWKRNILSMGFIR